MESHGRKNEFCKLDSISFVSTNETHKICIEREKKRQINKLYVAPVALFLDIINVKRIWLSLMSELWWKLVISYDYHPR